MGQSVLVFISHSSDDKQTFIEPLATDLEESYINVWLDKRKIMPGDNLRKSIFKDGLDKADIALIYFTQNSLQSSWVDREIKHILREEHKKGNDFDLKKIISIFDTQETYDAISDRYPELTDDLLHLMPQNYDKIHLSQLVSAIWSKYLSLQGGDVETQKQLLAKDREIFQKDKELLSLEQKIKALKDDSSTSEQDKLFQKYARHQGLLSFIEKGDKLVSKTRFPVSSIDPLAFSIAVAFGLVQTLPTNAIEAQANITPKGLEFFAWLYLQEEIVI